MQTLHDFYVVTKGQEYLIAVAFMVLFPVVWRLVNGPKRRQRSGRS